MTEKINIKGFDINSRFFFAPINTGLAKHGNPTQELINFHFLRSNTYTGINYVGNVAPEIGYVTNKGTLYINSTMHPYIKLAKKIEENGSIAGVQVGCLNSKYHIQRKWVNQKPNEYNNFIVEELKNLSSIQIKTIIKSFQLAIRKLSQSGFKVIQLHGAHGYLLNNFLSRSYNNRSDAYGKDRTLIIKEILDGLDAVCRNSIIDLRISLFEKKMNKTLSNDQLIFLKEICSIENIDMISISNGIYNLNKKLIYPPKKMGHCFMLPILKDFVLSSPEKIWNISGNISNLKELSNQENRLTYSIGRSVIANHNFIQESLIGNDQHVKSCGYKNKCHYFSRSREFIECGVNEQIY